MGLFAYAEPTRYAALVVNAQNGNVLISENANAQRYPASLTKIMTLYLLFEALENKQLNMNSPISFSQYASAQPPSKLGVKAGQSISVELAIKVLVVKSANDVSVAVAEKISGSEALFAARMNNTAKRLGMTHSHFRNPHGLPNPNQVTTAQDMVQLALALKRDFPQYYKYFSTKSFSYAGKTHSTHNRVLTSYAGADGMKTGYIKASGFNLVTSAHRGSDRLVGVVFGGRTAQLRDDHMKNLLDQGFASISGRTTFATPTSTQVSPPPIEWQGVAVSSPPSSPAVKLQTTTPQSTPLSNKGSDWSIQVGSFSEYTRAQNQARTVIRILKKGQIKILTVHNGNKKQYRALVVGLTQLKASQSCDQLKAQQIDCIVVRYKE